ncbi:MAG: c-type cytochrome [Methylococcaceae bacterium]|nr:c-type cytochrome [Methylococcaceae bacterium]MCI0668504.1 c-type cytochrome [Methylococcaceae bacterium]MCI0734470.1 c-type cytochrome [Methylococcaceae bacterium]
MRHHSVIQWLLLAVLISLIPAQALAGDGDPESGKRLFAKCRACHGADGDPRAYAESPVPFLGGQHSEYIVMALNGYAGGTRIHAGMQSRVEGLSAQQKQDIGAYLAQFELKAFSVPRSDTPSEIEQKVENCRSCHGERGNSFVAGFPRLIGQNRDYLIKVMRDYKNASRKNPTMVYIMNKVSENDLVRFADYYSSQPDGLSPVP